MDFVDFVALAYCASGLLMVVSGNSKWNWFKR
jgi:hypothetical protein